MLHPPGAGKREERKRQVVISSFYRQVRVFRLTNGKSILVVIVILQTVALRHHLQLAGDITAAADVGELRGRKQSAQNPDS